MKTEILNPVQDISNTLIERCRAGDRKAFHQIYLTYSKAMYNICLRMMNKKEDAEDVLQEAFINAFNHLQNFRGESSFGSWLKKIVVNHCINTLKKKKIKPEAIEDLDIIDETEPLDDCKSSDDYTVKQVQQAMSELAEGFRVILTMYLFEDYSHKEIAEAMGISEATSKSQYSRAKQKIRILLKTKNYEG